MPAPVQLRCSHRPPQLHSCSSYSPITRLLQQQHNSRRRRQRHAAAAASATTTTFNALAEWLRSRGGAARGVTLGDCRLGDSDSAIIVRGLVATRAAPAGETLLSVPLAASLCDDTNAAALLPYPGAPWNVCLAARLLQLLADGGGGTHGAYLATLPCVGDDDHSSPLAMTSANAAELVQYAPAAAALAEYHAAARAAHAAWQRADTTTTTPPTWPQFAWALHMVQSRSIRLAVAGCRALIPGVDLLNHGGAAANCRLALSADADGRAVCVVATRDLEAGEQVLWSYGERGNDDYFAYHGFVLANNALDDVLLFVGGDGGGSEGGVEEAARWAAAALAEEDDGDGGGGEVDVGAVATSARAAALAANVACASAHITGTTSSLLMPLSTQLERLGELQLNGNNKNNKNNTTIAQLVDEWASTLRHARGGVERRLASFRLHRPEWGTAACPAAAPELAARADGALDVRLLAALLAATAAARPRASAAELARLVRRLLRRRCAELAATFATSAADDKRLLQRLVGEGVREEGVYGSPLAAEAVRYRLGKKGVLARWMDEHAAAAAE